MNNMARLPYPRKRLRATGPQRSYGPEATQAAFLLGGIEYQVTALLNGYLDEVIVLTVKFGLDR